MCHDADGGWRFLGSTRSAEPAWVWGTVVSLREIVLGDPSLAALADLPLGGLAWREAAGKTWRRG